MTTLATLGVLAYATVDLYAARRLYGRWRARAIDREMANAHSVYGPRSREQQLDQALAAFRPARPVVMLGALIAVTGWPVALVIAGVARFFDSTPIKAQIEREVERDRTLGADHEHELGI